MPQDPAPNAFHAEWSEYRRRRRIFRLVVLSFLPSVALFMIIGRVTGWWNDGEDPTLLCLVWFPLFLVTGAREAMWRCPRCQGRFFRTSFGWTNTFATRCPHCHLPKWAGSRFASESASKAAVRAPGR